MKVIQVYAPTQNHSDEEIEIFYEDISKVMKENKMHFTVICGDFNAKVGLIADPTEIILGNYGSPGRNDRGETMISYLLKNNLSIMNSFYDKKQHRRWTWESPEMRLIISLQIRKVFLKMLQF